MHGEAGGGTQLFCVTTSGCAPMTLRPTHGRRGRPESDATKNDSYYVWGKPILAIADGVVKAISRRHAGQHAAINPRPGAESPSKATTSTFSTGRIPLSTRTFRPVH